MCIRSDTIPALDRRRRISRESIRLVLVMHAQKSKEVIKIRRQLFELSKSCRRILVTSLDFFACISSTKRLDSRLRPDVRDKTDVRRASSLNAPPYGGIIITKNTLHVRNNEQMRSFIHKSRPTVQ